MGYPVAGSRKPATPYGDLRHIVREELGHMMTPYLERLQVLLGERGPKDKSQSAVRKEEFDAAISRLEEAIRNLSAP